MNLITGTCSAEIIIVRCSPGEVDVQTALLVGDTNVSSIVLMRETPKNRDGESTKRTTVLHIQFVLLDVGLQSKLWY